MAAYDSGATVRISAAFTVAAVATDPTTIALTVRDPATPAVITTYTYGAAQITRDSTGNYHKDITVGTAGSWTVHWVGTGTCAAVDDDEFFIRPSTVD